ncbi:response regulator [bacterium]|nr:response regulator [bacterium]|tara:strand:+ start:13687 stop:14058 length:372 start_codon:yes stop_codon:yes gene_type:complete
MAEEGKKILLAEDETSIANALKLKLEHEKFTVTHVGNGNEALKAIQDNSFDLVLLDLMMPGKDGFAVLEELKEKGSKAKVLVTSNLGQAEDKERALALGATDFLVKSDTSLVDIVSRVRELAS